MPRSGRRERLAQFGDGHDGAPFGWTPRKVTADAGHAHSVAASTPGSPVLATPPGPFARSRGAFCLGHHALRRNRGQAPLRFLRRAPNWKGPVRGGLGRAASTWEAPDLSARESASPCFGEPLRTDDHLRSTLMDSDVYLLGAGFSKAVSDEMPNTKQLGKAIAERLAQSGHDVSTLAVLFDYDFEAWLSYLAEERPWATPSDNLRNRALFLDASRLIAVQLHWDQSRISGQDRPWLNRLVRYWHRQQSVALTLNYDTLIEEAVQASLTQSSGERVHFPSIYVVPITNPMLRQAGTFGGKDPDTMRFLKLHGSTNWYYSGSDTPHGETIYYGGLTHGWDASRPEVVGDQSLDPLEDKVPYIVPPTGTKSTFFNNETIRAQWAVAERFARGQGRLVVIGYSLPESDRMMRTFLAEGLGHRPLVLVNSDPGIVHHFRKLLPHQVIEDETWVGRADVVQEFVAALPEAPEDPF